MRGASTSDVDFFQDGIDKSQEVFLDKAGDVHVDGAYHNPNSQEFCATNKANLHLHAIQGAKSRYLLNLSENNELTVLDTRTNEFLKTIKIKGKNGADKWRIKKEKGYRYFTQKEIDTGIVRKKIENTPVETLQKRNNVEATIFQLGHHYPNAKSRYRGLAKHQMWADMGCLWVNFVRVLNFIRKTAGKITFHGKFLLKKFFDKLILTCGSFLQKSVDGNLSFFRNFEFVGF